MSGKNEILQKYQWIVRVFTFELYKARMFDPDVSICLAKFIKFLAPILSGKIEFTSGKCQEFKCMNPANTETIMRIICLKIV